MQKDYDAIIKKDGKFEKVQIKTSAEESYVFRVAKVKIGNMGDTETIRRAVINEKPVFAKIFEKIDKTIDGTNADKWLLVNVKEKATDFYFIGKEALKKIIKEHYRRAVETRNHTVSRRPFNAYIDKNNVYNPILTPKLDADLLKNYKI